jgi:hypothetical protein
MMSQEQTASEAIDFSRKLFGERHRFWAKPLVDLLESIKPKLALRWAIRLFQEALPSRRKAGSEPQQQGWLDDLTALVDRADVRDYCEKMTYEVWYNDKTFNLFERAISRLYTALQLFLEGNMQDYKGTVITAAVMLVEEDAPEESWDEPTFDRAIDLFRRVTDDR